MKNRKHIVTIFLALLLLVGSILPASAAGGTFTDVPSTHWAAGAIQKCYDAGLVEGVGNGRFQPDGTLTYAQFCTLMGRAFLADEVAANAQQGDAWYSAYLRTMEKLNLLDYSDGSSYGRTLSQSQIDAGIPRYDMALLIYNFAAVRCNDRAEDNKGSLSEAGLDAHYEKAVRWCYTKGLLQGHDDGRFHGSDTLTRAQACVLLSRLLDYVPVHTPDYAGFHSALRKAAEDMADTLDVSAFGFSSDLMRTYAYDFIHNGLDPYLYVSSCTCAEESGKPAKTLTIYYRYSKPSLEEKRTEHKEVLRIIGECCMPGMSDYEIAKALHDYLIEHCTYDKRLYDGTMPHESYTAYGALMKHTAVCDGYAHAYMELMNAAGVECVHVSGQGNGGGHAWNLVKIDGEWYHVDTTWDDHTSGNDNYVWYKYFLKSDAAISRDHSKWNRRYTCSSKKYDELYQLQVGHTTHILSEEEFEASLVSENEPCIVWPDRYNGITVFLSTPTMQATFNAEEQVFYCEDTWDHQKKEYWAFFCADPRGDQDILGLLYDVTFKVDSSDESVAWVTGNLVHLEKPGEVVLTLTAQSKNYNASRVVGYTTIHVI